MVTVEATAAEASATEVAATSATQIVPSSTSATSSPPEVILPGEPIQITIIEGIPANFKLQTNLKAGMRSETIKYLQIILNSDPDTRVAESWPGSKGNETNYFGVLTKKAVIRFQEKYASEVLAPWQLTKGTGLVGRTTQAKLNGMLGQ